MPHLKVLYFGLPGRAEATRLALAIGDVEFENKILGGEEWGQMKPSVTPLQLPLLEVDGKLVSQSMAQLRYACKLAKYEGQPLYPEDPFEALLVDELVDMVSETFPPMGTTFGIKDQHEKEAARAALVKPGGSVEKWAAHIDSILAKSESGFAVLERLTMADVTIFITLSMFRSGWLDGCPKDCFDHLSHVVKHKDMIAALPPVKKYYENATGLQAFFKC